MQIFSSIACVERLCPIQGFIQSLTTDSFSLDTSSTSPLLPEEVQYAVVRPARQELDEQVWFEATGYPPTRYLTIDLNLVHPILGLVNLSPTGSLEISGTLNIPYEIFLIPKNSLIFLQHGVALSEQYIEKTLYVKTALDTQFKNVVLYATNADVTQAVIWPNKFDISITPHGVLNGEVGQLVSGLPKSDVSPVNKVLYINGTAVGQIRDFDTFTGTLLLFEDGEVNAQLNGWALAADDTNFLFSEDRVAWVPHMPLGIINTEPRRFYVRSTRQMPLTQQIFLTTSLSLSGEEFSFII